MRMFCKQKCATYIVVVDNMRYTTHGMLDVALVPPIGNIFRSSRCQIVEDSRRPRTNTICIHVDRSVSLHILLFCMTPSVEI